MTKDEALRVAREALTNLLRVFPTDDDMIEAGWGVSEVNEACDVYDAGQAALRTIALAVEAPSNAMQPVALGCVCADQQDCDLSCQPLASASASGAVGETARTREQIMEQAVRWHDENTLGGPDCEHRQLEMLAYVEGYSAALAAALPGTSNGQENGNG